MGFDIVANAENLCNDRPEEMRMSDHLKCKQNRIDGRQVEKWPYSCIRNSQPKRRPFAEISRNAKATSCFFGSLNETVCIQCIYRTLNAHVEGDTKLLGLTQAMLTETKEHVAIGQQIGR